ncbi:hypothetical protein CWC48_28140 [Pseudomonas sp. S10E 269]|nr:hypothetical protein CWC49_08580 [Pseudomonas sp. S09F 262]PJK42837.1 hypothetical protein CWC48_28140 [Pseudomonas sp. S10E 269]
MICNEIKLWERACSRKRSVSRCIYQLTACIREQARSHIGFSAASWCAPVRSLHRHGRSSPP